MGRAPLEVCRGAAFVKQVRRVQPEAKGSGELPWCWKWGLE